MKEGQSVQGTILLKKKALIPCAKEKMLKKDQVKYHRSSLFDGECPFKAITSHGGEASSLAKGRHLAMTAYTCASKVFGQHRRVLHKRGHL